MSADYRVDSPSVVTEKVVTFSRQGRRFALPARVVQEVLAGREVTRVPAAASALAGLTNLRGTILPVVLPDAALALPHTHWNAGAPLLVLRLDDWIAAIQVDAVDGVIDTRSDHGVAHPMRETRPVYATLHRLGDGAFLSILDDLALRDAIGVLHEA